jgi:hypothetical protein
VQIDYLILADAVAVAEGKHYIHGGGWATLFAASFPATHPVLGVAARLRFSAEEANQLHTLEIDVVGEGGESILDEPLQRPVDVRRPDRSIPGSDRVLQLAFNITHLQFQGPGAYTIALRVDERDLETLRFNVVSLPEIPE